LLVASSRGPSLAPGWLRKRRAFGMLGAITGLVVLFLTGVMIYEALEAGVAFLEARKRRG